MNQPADGQLRHPLREWSRDPEEKKIAGVCAGISSQLDVPVTAVRALFVLLALPHFSSAGIVIYLILWFLMPARPGAGSGLDRVVGAVTALAGESLSGRPDDEDAFQGHLSDDRDPL